MNPEAEAHLKEILAKSPDALTQDDKDFLKARWHYVGKNSRAKFADIIEEKPAKKVKPAKPPVENLQHPTEQPVVDNVQAEGQVDSANDEEDEDVDE